MQTQKVRPLLTVLTSCCAVCALLMVEGTPLARPRKQRAAQLGQDAQESADFKRLYLRAESLLDDEEYQAALAAAREAQTYPSPRRGELHILIGKALLGLGQADAAVQEFERYLAEESSPSPESLREVRKGLAAARRLRTKATGTPRTPEHPTAAGTPAPHAADQTPLPKPEGTPEKSPVQRTASEQAYPMQFFGRNPSAAYSVAASAEDSCVTPCAMRLPAGPATVTVTGPGSKQFSKEILLPATSAQVRVQHFTLSRAIAGPILFVLGTGFLAGGGIGLASAFNRGTGNDTLDATLFGLSVPLLLHGVVFFFTGIGQMATIKRNSIEIRPLSIGGGPLSPRPRITSALLGPTNDLRGMMGGLAVRF